MDRSLFFGAAVLLFLVRDGRLLAARPNLGAAFALLVLGTASACGALADILSARQAQELLEDPKCWIPAVVIHAALSYWSGRRGRRGDPIDWLSILPAPVLMIALVGGSRMVLTYSERLTGMPVGAILGAGYALAVLAVSRSGRLTSSPASALRLASVAHVSALLLIPAAAILDRPLATQAFDWRMTGVVLSSVVLLVALSFAWHRHRHG